MKSFINYTNDFIKDHPEFTAKDKLLLRKFALVSTEEGFKSDTQTVEKDATEDLVFSIIILTHNALEYTKKAISSINNHTRVKYELTVIDNASTDGTRAWLKKQRGIDRLILNKTNHGVAKARNQGLKLATGQYIVFLDNDTEVKKDWDYTILSTFEASPSFGVVGKLGSDVASLNPFSLTNTYLDGGVREVDVVPGFCFAFKRELLRDIGFLDENLGKFWHEDLDFCLKAKLRGLRVVANPQIPIIHYQHKSVTTKKKVSDEQIKKKFKDFDENANKISKNLISSNVLYLFRNMHDNCSESYCVMASNLIREFRKLGMVVIVKPLIDTPPFSFNLCKGFDMLLNGKRFIVIHLENDRPPKDWLLAFKLVDYALCASPSVYRALEKAGIPKKKLVNLSLHGIDSNVFNFDIKAKSPKVFTFITVGASQPRKGIDLLIKAFSEEFKPKEKVRLIIKNVGYGQAGWVNELISESKHPNIKQIYADWEHKKLARFYKSVSLNGAFVQLHRGEAFGLPIYEAMACGMRIIVTDVGGVKDFLRYYPTVTKLNYSLSPSTFHNNEIEPYYKRNEHPLWATPSIKDIRKAMRNVYKQRYNLKEAREVSEEIIAWFDYEMVAKRAEKEMRRLSLL